MFFSAVLPAVKDVALLTPISVDTYSRVRGKESTYNGRVDEEVEIWSRFWIVFGIEEAEMCVEVRRCWGFAGGGGGALSILYWVDRWLMGACLIFPVK